MQQTAILGLWVGTPSRQMMGKQRIFCDLFLLDHKSVMCPIRLRYAENPPKFPNGNTRRCFVLLEPSSPFCSIS